MLLQKALRAKKVACSSRMFMWFVASADVHPPPVSSLPKAAPHPFVHAPVCTTMLGLGQTMFRLTVGIFSIHHSSLAMEAFVNCTWVPVPVFYQTPGNGNVEAHIRAQGNMIL